MEPPPKNQATEPAYNSYVASLQRVQDIFRTTNPYLVNDPLISD